MNSMHIYPEVFQEVRGAGCRLLKICFRNFLKQVFTDLKTNNKLTESSENKVENVFKKN